LGKEYVMRKTLTRHGNSKAIVIDKGILDLLHITDETLLEIRTDGKRLIVEPVSEPSHMDRVREALEWTNGKYDSALRKLAG
jgi:antitoxin MazE